MPRPDGDPDAYRPGGDPLPVQRERLDPAYDPDRYLSGVPAADSDDLVRPLPRLPGEPADEPLPVAAWLVGLLSVFGFLALVTLAIRLAGG